MPNGRQLLLERKSESADSFSLWLEPFDGKISGVNTLAHYPANKTRHSGLGKRRVPKLSLGHPVVHVTVDSMLSLKALVQAYGEISLSRVDEFLKKYANRTLREFVEQLTNEETDAFITCYEHLRAALPEADIYTTHRQDGFKDIRIGVREREKKKGKPYFMMYRAYGSLFVYEYENKCHEIDQHETLEKLDMLNTTDEEKQVWFENQATRYGQHILGQGLNPKDYTEDAEDQIEQIAEGRIDMPLNQILFGPPGTGKTYHTAIKALEILDPHTDALMTENYAGIRKRYNELVKEDRISFVTFHQSFSYEDFVEGIKAETKNGSVEYTIEDGVFKQLCRVASNRSSGAANFGIRDHAKTWKISIDGTGASDRRKHCFENNEARIGWGHVGDLTDNARNQKQIDAFNKEGSNNQSTLMAFAEGMQVGDVVLCIKSAQAVQAVGVVTGEYEYEQNTSDLMDDYPHLRKVDWIVHGVNIPFTDLNKDVGFTLKTVYELKRISPEAVLKRLKERNLLPKESSISAETKDPVVLVIDEINRGNISRIFGELITLLEPSKRAGADEALTVTLPYSKEPFTVPENLYVIGTMNTADRSLSQLDIALRRRFEFIEMMPDVSLLDGVEVEGISIKQLLKAMNERIEALLDRDHTLGHSYFLPLKQSGANTLENLARIFEKQILPLLQEYFFEDWERIHWVLNDHQKPEQYQFIWQQGHTKMTDLFGDKVGKQVSDRRWRINLKAFSLAESYQQTIQKQVSIDPAIEMEAKEYS